ncbi:MAG: 2-oxoacid:acceptor oxidoreductase family protein [Phycisphaerae bacterium]
MKSNPRFPGIRVTTNGNKLVSYLTEARLAEGGVFYPITPSTEMGELFQQSYAEGKLNVFGRPKVAIEAEGEHAAQGGAIALSVTGKRVVNFTSGQGLIYALEQYYHAPGKGSTMVVEVAARALTKHALNVHCGHDDVYAALDTGWIVLFAKTAQQAADHSLILRRTTERCLTPGINAQDGFLTSHLERTFLMHEAELIREFLGDPDDIIETPTPAQRKLFGSQRRRIPCMIDLKNPILLGPVQNQEHYMNGVVARRNHFAEHIEETLRESYRIFGELTGRHYNMISTHRTEDADYVFISLGSAAENIEAAVDHLRETRNAKVGSIHVNVLRPFPSTQIVEALRGKKACIILERTDEPLANDNPLARDVRAALTKSYVHPGFPHREGMPEIRQDEVPRNFSGVYGMGSRDFRPEHIIGAYEYVAEGRARKDGKRAADGVTFFSLGVDHEYAVESDETPSLLPDDSIAVRFHSIGGWGMITTGKNLSEVIGEFGSYMAKRDHAEDADGQPKEVLHVSANPKYGSEKKGAPTNYFLVVAPERIRVNCDLRHVDVVLCCDPKAFTHSNPIEGLKDGGAFVWESDEEPEVAWERIPQSRRQEISERNLKVHILPGFEIARNATARADLQLRMQGNAFLGAFFKVSPFLEQNGIDEEHFHEVVRNQYQKKFGRFGEAVVQANMEVMIAGFDRCTEVPIRELDAPDRSSMRGLPVLPQVAEDFHNRSCVSCHHDADDRAPLFRRETFEKEFKAGLGYHQPASELAAVGVMAAATGDSASKYVARRETPVFIPENCTQCMECIAVCPDTALPNTAQPIATVLNTAIRHYVEDRNIQAMLIKLLPDIEKGMREQMLEGVSSKNTKPFHELLREALDDIPVLNVELRAELVRIMESVPVAYEKVNAIFSSKEKRNPGSGGVFSIFVSDLCKGCGECVTACGSHQALRMEPDSETLNARNATAQAFFDQLPTTDPDYLGLYDDEHPEDSKPAALRNHLMVRSNYEAIVAGDGACAGCGEKSVLRSVASITEAYMRPIYHARAARILKKANALKAEGEARLKSINEKDADTGERIRQAVLTVLMGLGGEDPADVAERQTKGKAITGSDLINAIAMTLEQDAHNHRDLQSIDGRLANGMAVMAMGASTGCNTVYGSTPPNNPHPYPWMNSLFQDGATVAWLVGESFVMDHARRSVTPERLADLIMDEAANGFDEHDLFDLQHMTDTIMTEREIRELPKVWAVGGDGGFGDIGFQNVSKVIMQNRPNVQVLMLDTQVYSNTGGQNSESSPSPGGFDMNQIGEATQGKLTEKKGLAEIFMAGHGSPFVAQVSMANAAKLYKSILDGLSYRGTAFLQCFTTCQPEHGVGDSMAGVQAKRIRDSRGMPEFVFNPHGGESYGTALSLQGNPSSKTDWWTTTYKANGERYTYTVAHWAATEARFRRHFKRVTDENPDELIRLDDMLVRITQEDVVHRRFRDPDHRAFVPDFRVVAKIEVGDQPPQDMLLSRQMVLFCVERRKAWRMLQSKAGITNFDYVSQREVLRRIDEGEVDVKEFMNSSRGMLEEVLAGADETCCRRR